MKIISPRYKAVLLTVGLLFFTLLPLDVHSQDPAPIQTLESDDPRVLQSGTWSSQTASVASNGSYLYSTPASVGADLLPTTGASESHPDDTPVLALAFVGSAIEIIYVAGPHLGTLAIEIDGIVVRTVITTTEKIEYAQAARVDYLSDEPHSLKVYAQAGGTIAIDAFRISPLSSFGEGSGGEVAFSDDGGIQSSTCAPLNAIHRVNFTSTGQQAATNPAVEPVLSSDGRYVAFETQAFLTSGDTNLTSDIFVYDRQTCAITLVSVSSAGIAGNGFSRRASISADGRYVAFDTISNNLVAGDNNGTPDVFLHDRQTAITIRVSVGAGNAQGNATSINPAISANGRFIAFYSAADNLVTGDTNTQNDIFVYDRQSATTTRVSVATGGTQAIGGLSAAPAISADGRYVTFESASTNLVTGDTNGQSDIFVHDRQTTTTTRVSVATGGTQANGTGSYNPAMSADGRYIAFESSATNLVIGDTNGQYDVFVHDRQTNSTTRVSVATGGTQGNGGSFGVTLSADGRYVGFESGASNLVIGDTGAITDVFAHDRQTTTTTRISVNTGGSSPDNTSADPVFSADGRYIAFSSLAATLVNGDTNGIQDAFVAARNYNASETLALFQPNFQGVFLLDTLADNPPAANFTFFSAYAPVSGGQWIMGDWDGDGLKTPGVYLNGAFHFTNDLHETKTWQSLWIGVNGPVVAGAEEHNYDCVAAVQAANFPPFGTAFVLYMVCDLSGNPTPLIFNSQWLSVLLPDSGGFSGTHQFVMGDWDGNGSDTIAVRRGAYITWTNDSIFTSSPSFSNAQYIGAPGTGSEGILVDSDWNRDGTDSFGLFYQNGELFYRNDLLFNSGTYVNQSVGTPFGNSGIQASTWR